MSKWNLWRLSGRIILHSWAHSYRFGCFFVASPQTILIPKVLFMVPNVAISIHIIKYRFINVMIIRPTFTPKHSQGLILVRPRKGASKTIALSRSQKAYWKMSESNQKFQVVFFEARKVQKKKSFKIMFPLSTPNWLNRQWSPESKIRRRCVCLEMYTYKYASI